MQQKKAFPLNTLYPKFKPGDFPGLYELIGFEKQTGGPPLELTEAEAARALSQMLYKQRDYDEAIANMRAFLATFTVTS
jgi:hypothetical protein